MYLHCAHKMTNTAITLFQTIYIQILTIVSMCEDNGIKSKVPANSYMVLIAFGVDCCQLEIVETCVN